MSRIRIRWALAAAVLFALSLPSHARAAVGVTPAPAKAAAKASPKPTPTPTPPPPYTQMTWREIGPAAGGGRITSVAGSATNVKLYFVGSAGGGVWKTINGGFTWTPVFANQKVAAIGAVAIDPSNNNVVWVGTGESNPRNDVSYGDGLYKSTNGGITWKRVGLKGVRSISRIAVDPKDGNHVVVAAFGDPFRNSVHRGVYVTFDGGKTWKKTLYLAPDSGASDLAMVPSDPNVVYAGMWEFRRKPWTFRSGGPNDGLYKSVDGGKTWTKLVGNGLPTGITGRIGLAVSQSDPNYVYALIEAAHGILWRSEDAGKHWKMVSDNTLVDQRPFYFTHIAVDPMNPKKVYAVSELTSVSTDGGKKFRPIALAVHVDYHAIWIAPNDPSRIMLGEDGGYALTVDGGANWFFSKNLPIAQIYHVGLSNENPYEVCAGLQDNNAFCGPENSLDPSGLLNKYWKVSVGGDGEWSVPDPSDPNYIWSDSENGSVVVWNKRTQDEWSAQPYLQGVKEQYDLRTSKYRFNWDSPIAFAPWNPHIGWVGGNVVFQSTDRGKSFKVISPDLTLNMKSHQIPSGGPITHDVSGAEYSDTLLDIEGSPVRKGEIWTGADDGVIGLTVDGGKHWKKMLIPGVPPYGRVETVAPSPFDAATAYVTIDRHRSGDYKPYVFVTHNYGKTWNSIASNLPKNVFVRTIRPDIRNSSILYLGNETGIFISFDDGQKWESFKNGMPTVSVRDIRMQPTFDDLVIATHGRSLYIMDDMTPIQQLARAQAAGGRFFPVRVSYQYTLHENDEGTYTDFVGNNPPYGAIFDYYQKTANAKTPPSLQIFNARGQLMRSISGTHKVAGKEQSRLPNAVGLNRYVWDYGTNGVALWKGAAKKSYQGFPEGPAVPPGTYTAKLTFDGKTYTRRFVVKPDPRSKFTQADYDRTFAFSMKYEAMFGKIDTMLNNLDTLKKQIDAAEKAATAKKATGVLAALSALSGRRQGMFDILTANYQNDEDSIERPGALREDFEQLYFAAQSLITPPTLAFAHRLDGKYARALGQYNAFVGTLPALQAEMKAAGLKPIAGIGTVH